MSSESNPSETPQSGAASENAVSTSGVTAAEWLTMPDLVDVLDETPVSYTHLTLPTKA